MFVTLTTVHDLRVMYVRPVFCLARTCRSPLVGTSSELDSLCIFLAEKSEDLE